MGRVKMPKVRINSSDKNGKKCERGQQTIRWKKNFKTRHLDGQTVKELILK